MNDLDNKFGLAFYDSFLKIELNCDKDFEKEMLPNLTCVLITSLTKCVLEDGFNNSCVLKILQIL